MNDSKFRYDVVRPIDVSKIILREAVIPDISGVYFIFCKSPGALFDKGRSSSMTKTNVDTMELIYIGSTDGSLHDRVRAHLSRSSLGSSFRRTLGALLIDRLELNVIPTTKVHFSFGDGESRLTQWIGENCAIAYLPLSKPRQTERFLVRLLRPSINVSYRRIEIGAQFLMKAVARARQGCGLISAD